MSEQISIEQLTDIITQRVTKQLSAQFAGKLETALAQVNTNIEQRKEKITLTGGRDRYDIVADSDGISFNKKEKSVLLIARNGQLAAGTKSPRTTGTGSAHFKMGNSEAVMPTTGAGSTRGVIVEGDGDDEQTFVFRAVSKMNRQGLNVFSDGALSVGSMNKPHDAQLSVTHKSDSGTGAAVCVRSKQHDGTVLITDAGAAMSPQWAHYRAFSETGDAGYETEVTRIDGEGNVCTNGALYSNNTGYAEMFEWADANAQSENRIGFTVTLDKRGKLRVATEGDRVIGVVTHSAAIVGNAQWNHWHNKYFTDKFSQRKQTHYEIVEWLETETGILKSYFKADLPGNFSLPENAIEIQTDSQGNALCKGMINSVFDEKKTYAGRQHRSAWATVCLLGTVPVYKGQVMGSNWVSVRDINDELEMILVK